MNPIKIWMLCCICFKHILEKSVHGENEDLYNHICWNTVVIGEKLGETNYPSFREFVNSGVDEFSQMLERREVCYSETSPLCITSSVVTWLLFKK